MGPIISSPFWYAPPAHHSKKSQRRGHRTMSSSTTTSNKRKRSCSDDFIDGDGAGHRAKATATATATAETLGGGNDDVKKKTCAACKTDIPCLFQHPGATYFEMRGQCTHVLCAACMNRAHCLRCQRAWNECLVCPVENCRNAKVRDYVGYTVTVDAEDGRLRLASEEYEIHVPLTLSHLNDNLIAKILSNLDWKEIIKVSITCKDMCAASKGMTYEAEMKVDHERTANNLVNIGKAFKIQALRIETSKNNLGESWVLLRFLRANSMLREIHDDSIIAGEGHSDRERRVEGAVDLNVALSALPDLKSLCITQKGPKLDGFYPVISGLTKLQMIQLNCEHLCLDLASFEAMPHLLAIDLAGCRKVSGNLSALNHLKYNLGLLDLRGCRAVRGNLNDLSDFSTLVLLDLSGTNVSGSICNVRPGDFPDLCMLYLNSVSLDGSHLESILDARRLMVAWQCVLRRPGSFLHKFGQTSEDGWEWEVRWNGSDIKEEESSENGIIGRLQVPRYAYNPVSGYEPPECLKMINIAGILGYRFGCTKKDESNCVSSGANDCDVVWLDEEPKPGDENFEYFHQLKKCLSRPASVFSGLTAPPVTRQEYVAFLREKEVDFNEEDI